MTKRPVTASYIFFYVLFSQDTYRIGFAILFSVLVTPYAYTPDTDIFGRAVLHAMVAGIGFAAGGLLGRLIVRILKKWILGDKAPQ